MEPEEKGINDLIIDAFYGPVDSDIVFTLEKLLEAKRMLDETEPY